MDLPPHKRSYFPTHAMTAVVRPETGKKKTTVEGLIADGILPEKPKKRTWAELVEDGTVARLIERGIVPRCVLEDDSNEPEWMRAIPTLEEEFIPDRQHEEDTNEWRLECARIIQARKAARKDEKHARKEEKHAGRKARRDARKREQGKS